MARKTTLETIWYIPEDLWDKVRPLLGREKKAGTVGRPCVPHRTCLDGILFIDAPAEHFLDMLVRFGDGKPPQPLFRQVLNSRREADAE